MLTYPPALVFLMGIAAVLSPCGIALLPASVAFLMGTGNATARPVHRIGNGLWVSVLLTLGFLTVVAAVGLLIKVSGIILSGIIRPASVALSLLVVVGGILVATGRFHFSLTSLENRLAPPTSHGARLSWQIASAGVVYGLGALSCTLPLFVAAMIPALTAGPAAFVTLLLLFGAGAGLLLTLLSVGALFLRDSLLHFFLKVAPRLNLVLGLIIAASGSYMVYYWVLGPGRFLG